MQLFPHQIKGVDFLTSSEGTKGLFFGMGTGKTLTAIYAFNKSDATRMLVIAPPIALPMWSNECIEHGDIDYGRGATGWPKPPVCWSVTRATPSSP